MAREAREGRGRRILGWTLVGLGAASILDFFSPIPIPTVGFTAVASGVFLMAGGFYVLYLRGLDLKRLFRRGGPGADAAPERSRPTVDPLVPVAILRLARESGGVLTVSAVAMGLSIPLDVAEAGLDICVERGTATPEYDEPRGTMTWRFPEFLPPQGRQALP